MNIRELCRLFAKSVLFYSLFRRSSLIRFVPLLFFIGWVYLIDNGALTSFLFASDCNLSDSDCDDQSFSDCSWIQR